MQQIADWLEKLGMSEYAQRFAQNDIDIEVLSELTDTDFDRLGVSIGHRRKLLKALAAGVPTAAAASPSSAIASSLAPEQSRTAEAARPISSSNQIAEHDGEIAAFTGSYFHGFDQHFRAARRGRITLISVNSPGLVSTSIDPECCFTMMS